MAARLEIAACVRENRVVDTLSAKELMLRYVAFLLGGLLLVMLGKPWDKLIWLAIGVGCLWAGISQEKLYPLRGTGMLELFGLMMTVAGGFAFLYEFFEWLSRLIARLRR